VKSRKEGDWVGDPLETEHRQRYRGEGPLITPKGKKEKKINGRIEKEAWSDLIITATRKGEWFRRTTERGQKADGLRGQGGKTLNFVKSLTGVV